MTVIRSRASVPNEDIMREDKGFEAKRAPGDALSPKIEEGRFRSGLGHYPTGVCVITGCNNDGETSGFVVGSFTSASLDPPLIAFFPDRRSSSWPRIRACGRFCVNVLSEDQLEICSRFATTGGPKFEGISYRSSSGGIPVLDGSLLYIECTIENEIDAGDHTMVLGRIREIEVQRSIGPLLFHKGEYGRFEPSAGAPLRQTPPKHPQRKSIGSDGK